MITPVKHIMAKKLMTVPTGTSLFEAYQLMDEKRIRHLPVVDQQDQVVGVLARRDLNAVPDSKNIPVEYMMNSPVQFVSQDLPVRKAVFQMLQMKISSLLIADENDNAVGIVTTDDFLWFLNHLLEDETEKAPSLFSARTRQTIGEVANQLSQMGI
jgi:acetoin utilization protein AcuB